MKVTFVWPTYPQFSGGVATLFDYATALVARGHEVHLVHGPLVPGRIGHLDEIDWFDFDPRLQHHIVDRIDDPTMPHADVIFGTGGSSAPELGLPASLIQGYGLLQASLERRAFHAPGPKICVASWLTDVGIRWGVPGHQLMHVPLGMDHELFQPPPPEEHRPIDVAMLYSTHPAKGGPVGIAALEAVRRLHPELRVAMFGLIEPDDGAPEWADYHLGLTRAELVEQVYQRARIFLQPSRLEGFGLTAVEAMACGAALVTTDNGGASDYAVADETAVVAPADDPASLAKAVGRLLGDEQRRRRIAEEGERFVRRFRWERSGELLEKALEDYLADPEPHLHQADSPPRLPVSEPRGPAA